MTEFPEKHDFLNLDELDVGQFDRAVIFYWAPWSGPAHASYTLLTDKLSRSPLPIKLMWVDSNNSNSYSIESLTAVFGAIPHAFGEVCWIAQGKIVGQDRLGKLEPGQTWQDIHDLVEQRIEHICVIP
jgi:hypothetical protein